MHAHPRKTINQQHRARLRQSRGSSGRAPMAAVTGSGGPTVRASSTTALGGTWTGPGAAAAGAGPDCTLLTLDSTTAGAATTAALAVGAAAPVTAAAGPRGRAGGGGGLATAADADPALRSGVPTTAAPVAAAGVSTRGGGGPRMPGVVAGGGAVGPSGRGSLLGFGGGPRDRPGGCGGTPTVAPVAVLGLAPAADTTGVPAPPAVSVAAAAAGRGGGVAVDAATAATAGGATTDVASPEMLASLLGGRGGPARAGPQK